MRLKNRSNSIFLLFFLGITNFSFSQKAIQTEADLLNFLSGKDVLVDSVLKNRNFFHLQMVYTPIKKQGDSISFETVKMLTGDYFYPASTVKLPTALLTLEKLNRLGLSLDDVLKINSDNHCGNEEYITLSQKNDLSFRKMINELIVVSNNTYYNSLYQFLTPEEINESLDLKGFKKVNIYKYFSGCDMAGHLKCNSLNVNRGEDVVYEQQSCVLDINRFTQNYSYSEDKLFGSKHEYQGVIVDGPYDFNYNLEIPLEALHEMLIRLIYPEKFPANLRWKIREEDRLFLIKALGMFPNELEGKEFKDPKKYPNNIYKYILLGEDVKDQRTVSKIGLAYGFSTEIAFVECSDIGAYFLSVSMYTNANNTVNDGKYEYEQIARPFMARVGKLLLDLNLSE